MKTELLTQLVRGMKKATAESLADDANADVRRYRTLLDIVEKGEPTPAMKASWIIGTAARKDPAMARKYAERIFDLLKRATIGGVQRELLKALDVVEFKEDKEGEFLDYCFKMLNKPGIDVAIRYYCILILRRMLKKYPELEGELLIRLEEMKDWHNDPWKRYITRTIQSVKRQGKNREDIYGIAF